MKTPHTITLFRGETKQDFDPMTGEYTSQQHEVEKVPCLVTRLNQKKVFEAYGNHEDKIITVRFSQAQRAFQKAEFEGETYKPVETTDTFIKGAIRLKRTV